MAVNRTRRAKFQFNHISRDEWRTVTSEVESLRQEQQFLSFAMQDLSARQTASERKLDSLERQLRELSPSEE